MSNKFKDIHQIVKLIPKGRVSNYGAIAAYYGSPRGARLVGWAMNNAHDDPSIPAHRVVNKQGILSGKNNFSTPTIMQELLEAEGIKIINNQIQNFKEVFWDPAKELL